jgi:Helix-turn-helix domain
MMSGRSKDWVSHARWVKIWQLKRRGWGQRQIGRSLKVSHSTVQYYIRKGPPPGWKPDTRPDAEVIDLARRRGAAS